jgi:hypothetical protein
VTDGAVGACEGSKGGADEKDRENARRAKPVIYCLADHKRLRTLVIYDAITRCAGGDARLVHANTVFVAADTRSRRITIIITYTVHPFVVRRAPVSHDDDDDDNKTTAGKFSISLRLRGLTSY